MGILNQNPNIEVPVDIFLKDAGFSIYTDDRSKNFWFAEKIIRDRCLRVYFNRFFGFSFINTRNKEWDPADGIFQPHPPGTTERTFKGAVELLAFLKSEELI